MGSRERSNPNGQGKIRRTMQRPGIVLQPNAGIRFSQGIDMLLAAIRPTLGPLPRLTVVDGVMPGQMPELLDQGGLIARRLVALTERDADMGAMYLRQMLWRLYEEMGDGTATAAILFHAIYQGGQRAIAAGENPMRLRGYLEQAGELLGASLREQAMPITTRESLSQVAHSHCQDQQLANIIGEALHELGEFGYVKLRKGKGRGWMHEYVLGSYWEGGVHTQSVLVNGTIRGQQAALFLSDLAFDDPRDLVPLIETALAAGCRSLMIIAESVSDRAQGLLNHASKEPDRFLAFAVKPPSPRGERMAHLQDLAHISGGDLFLQVLGTKPAHLRQGISPTRLGRAEDIWANRQFFGISARPTETDTATIALLQGLQSAFAKETDSLRRMQLQQRLGNLQGASATIYAGGTHETEIEIHKSLAERTLAVTRSAMRDGLVPGGGIAFWQMRACVAEEMTHTDCDEARCALSILQEALAAPLTVLLLNAGFDPAVKIAQIEGEQQRRGDINIGCDVLTGEIVNLVDRGIVDSAGVQLAAMQSAVKAAALALTIDVLVHRRSPEFSATP